MRAKRGGFTLIEVMVSLGVMTIGALAILALLAHILRANGHTRQMNTAMGITASFIDHFKQDAHSWVQAAAAVGAPTPATVLTNTLYLRFVPATPSGSFVMLPAGGAVVSRAHDYQGRPVVLPVVGNTQFFYCTAFRLSWTYFGQTIRADLRTFWPRAGADATNIMTDWPNCDRADHDDLDPGESLAGKYHVFYSSTSVSVTPVIR